jgi:alpha-ribazole phosphatase
VYITSGLKRANETLRILYNREPDFVIGEFKEIHLGDFEMKTYDELKDKLEYQLWINDFYNFACPNGESNAEFDERVKAGLDKLSDIKTDSAVIICHGGVIVSIMERMFPNQKNFFEWQPENGRGYILEFNFENTKLISEI